VSNATAIGYRPFGGVRCPSDQIHGVSGMLRAMRTPRGRGGSALRAGLRLAVPGVIAGAAGTAAMTTSAHLNRVRYARRHGLAPSEITEILDYDDSEYVVIAASTLLRGVVGRAPASDGGRRALFLVVHWGYGSAVGIAHAALRRYVVREPLAGSLFFLGCQAMCLTLFPVLGGTPVPWRWQRSVMTTSVGQHVLYSAVVAATAAGFRRVGTHPAG
jgi:hypothetical protein